MLDSREIAYVIWGTLFLIVSLFSKQIRPSVISLIGAVFCNRFIIVYFFALSYISLCVFLLYKINLWDNSLISDTLKWFLFVALPLMYNSAKVDSFAQFIKKVVRPLITFSVIFEYIVGLHTFDLWIEILSVPLFLFIVIMMAASERKLEYRQVYKLMKGIYVAIIFGMLLTLIVHFFNQYASYLNRMALLKFVVPLSLSLSFLPFLYGLSMFVHYESVFKALKGRLLLPGAYQYAMFKALLRFKGDIDGMERWRRMVISKDLQTRKEIDDSISLIKTLQNAEQNPQWVDEEFGWSPYKVKDLLTLKGIKTADYKNTFEEKFSSTSFVFKVTEDPIFYDTMTFKVSGEQLIATELYLELGVFNGTVYKSSSLKFFLECSHILYQSLFGLPLPEKIIKAINEDKNTILRNDLAYISIEKRQWLNETKGYNLGFKITHIKHRL